MTENFYIGIDIGGTKCAVVAGTAKMEILSRNEFATASKNGPVYVISALLEITSDFIHNLSDHKLLSIGISCGGPLNSKSGIIQSPPNLPGWDNIEIVRIFRDKFDVPVFLQNDANACALAEWRFGAGKGTENMIFLTFGTGLGAGLILNGKLYSGTNDMAGEIGHIRLADEGPEGYGKNGSFEGFCSGAGIARLAGIIIGDRLHSNDEISIHKKYNSPETLNAKVLAQEALAGDKTAIEVFAISAKYLGIGLSYLIDILNPQRIVIGSIYARNPLLFEKISKEVIDREALKQSIEVCEIVPATLGDQIGDYACLSVAMNS